MKIEIIHGKDPAALKTTEFTGALGYCFRQSLLFIRNMSPVAVHAIRITEGEENEPVKEFRTSGAHREGDN